MTDVNLAFSILLVFGITLAAEGLTNKRYRDPGSFACAVAIVWAALTIFQPIIHSQ